MPVAYAASSNAAASNAALSNATLSNATLSNATLSNADGSGWSNTSCTMSCTAAGWVKGLM